MTRRLDFHILLVATLVFLLSSASLPSKVTAASLERTLGKGSRGGDVFILQKTLNQSGYPVAPEGPGATGEETGYFGVLTATAVKSFQCAEGIVCSGDPTSTGFGIVGPKTRSILNRLISSLSNFLTGETSSSQIAAISGAGSGLVGHWAFDEGSGTTANDSSGNNNIGTLVNGPVWTTGKIGQALTFNDGGLNRVNVPVSPTINNLPALSVSLWANPTTIATYAGLVAKYDDNSGGHGWFLATANNSGAVRFYHEYDGTIGNLQVTSENGVLEKDVWHHIVLTWDGSLESDNVRMYRDGVELTGLSRIDGEGNRVSDAQRPIYVGNRRDNADQEFIGSMDDVRIYNRALSAAEVKELYDLGSASTPLPPPPPPPPPPSPTPINGLCGATVNTCAAGTFVDLADTPTDYLWRCDGQNGGANASCSIPKTPPPADTTPPSVSITAPGAGATVSGTVSISASASDDIAVAGVQFRLNGVSLGTEDTSSPYSISWDTTRVSNGSHTLTALARDASGNTTTSSSINVAVSNTVPPPPGAASYIRDGATGTTCADWGANACDTLPVTLVRGTTYYVADGDYAGYTFDDLVSGAQLITIKKATAADHGTSTGWVDMYGDGQTSFGKLVFDSSYWVFDGNSATWSYGFIVSGASSGRNVGIGTGVDESVDFVTVKGTSIDSKGVAGVRGLQVSKASNVLIENVETWNNDNDCVQMSSGQGVVFDHFRCHTRNDAGAGTHGDAFELATSPPPGGLKNVLRYSIIDWKGQQVFFGGTGSPADHGAWDIYGNLFINSAGSPSGSTKGLTDHDNPQSIGPLNVYNNVFDSLYLAHDWDERTSGSAFNNIYYNLNTLGNFGNTTHDYNYFDSTLGSLSGEVNGQGGGNPFISRTSKDYRLVSATRAGRLLSSPYTTDLNGNPRGGDGNWDRGAYEYISGGTPPPPPPPPPPETYTLTIFKSGTGSGTVTGTGVNCGADCSETVNSGTIITLTASPTSGSTFSGWSGGGCSGTGTCTVTISANSTVTATFDMVSPPPPAPTGDLQPKFVGPDLTTSTVPAGIEYRVDGGSLIPASSATITRLSAGSHTLGFTDISGYTESYASCTYPRSGSECFMTDTGLYTTTGITCAAGFCSLSFSIAENTVTKVAVRYVLSSPPPPPPPPPPPTDTTSPDRSNGLPSGALVVGTTSATLSLATNETATCKYATTANVAYASMANTFSATGGVSHSIIISGLANGQSYNYYVRCRDAAGNTNIDDYPIIFSVTSPPQSGVINVVPTVTDLVLANPYKGFALWANSFYSNPPIPQSLVFEDVLWRELEPQRGVFNWDALERYWKQHTDLGRKVGFRFEMVNPSDGIATDIPQWLVDMGVPLRQYTYTSGRTGYTPDWDNATLLAEHDRVIAELGKRYNNDSRVAWIDVGSYGFYGEWHMYLNENLAASQTSRQRMLDAYINAFPNKELVIAFDNTFATQYLTQNSGGIRNDCLGPTASNDWFTRSMISDQISPATVSERAIITGEFCNGSSGAVDSLTNRFTENMQFIRDNHWSWVGPNTGPFWNPPTTDLKTKLETFYKALGYNFAFTALSHNQSVTAGDTLQLTVTVRNTGSAPFYYSWPFEVSLTNTNTGQTVMTANATNLNSQADPMVWLPGDKTFTVNIPIPSTVAADTYSLGLAILDPATGRPGIQFNNTGKGSDGRYMFSSVVVRSGTIIGNQPPAVSITSPTNGQNFPTAPASITVTASASDSDGTIQRVEFYNGTTLLNTDTTSPYSYTWTNVSAGAYSLTVKVFDNVGASATSQATTVTVNASPSDTTPPVISGIAVSSITASGAAVGWSTNEPSDTQVEYGMTVAYGQSTPLNTSPVTSHSEVLSGLTANTLYHFRVRSRDAAGNLALSSDQTFTTGASPTPALSSVSITTPDSTASESGDTGRFTVSRTGSTDTSLSVNLSISGSATPILDYLSLPTSLIIPQFAASTSLTLSPTDDVLVESAETVILTVSGNPAYAVGVPSSATVTIGDNDVPAPVPGDTTPPVISSVTASSVSATAATVSWTTDERGTSQVGYGTSTAFRRYLADPSFATAHALRLTGLSRNTTYHFAVSSTDSSKNTATSTDQTFKTAIKPGKVKSLSATFGSVHLAWELPDDPDLDSILIFRGTTEVSDPTSGIPLATLPPAATTFTDTATSPETTYTYSLFTRGSDGAFSDPSVISVTTPEEGTPEPQPEPPPSPGGGGGGGGGSGGGGGGGGGSFIPPTPVPGTSSPVTPRPPVSPVPSVPVPSSVTPSIPRFSKSLYPGVADPEVRNLQRLLVTLGFLDPSSLTGFYGPKTRRAIEELQKVHGIVAGGSPETTGFGLVGRKTREKLNELRGQTSGGAGTRPPETSQESVPPVVSPPHSGGEPTAPEITTSAFSRTLSAGMRGEDVKRLQTVLNRTGFAISETGPGSSGNETTFFGQATKAALIRFQEAYADEVLTPIGLTTGTGIFGPRTREVLLRLGGVE